MEDGLWRVKFNKFQTAWGDYIKAIARSFYVVLNTLKSAGLPFDAPNSVKDVEIVATASEDNTVYVRCSVNAVEPRRPPVSSDWLYGVGGVHAVTGDEDDDALDEIHQQGLDVLRENNFPDL
jgi:hypothetical protein